MKRADMLRCAGMEPGRFDILRRRDQLPIIYPTPLSQAMESDFEAVAAHSSEYTLDDAFRLRLMLDLLGGEASDPRYLGGLGPSTAANMVARLLGDADFDVARHPWVGAAIYEDQGDGLRWTRWYLGDLSDLPGWLGEERAVPVRLFLANAARAWAVVSERARALGVQGEPGQ